jgi:ABC-type glycerol-3-phosphate transport system substrate-binding protein
MSSAALITAPYIRSANAAGKLNIGFWDHWVPGANKASTELVNEWAAKEKVEVSIDYIPSQGNKNLLTIAAEAQAKSGHDILAMPTWWPHAQAELLEPMNDVVEALIKQNGEVNDTVKYLGKSGDKWLAVPACIGSQIKGPCSRIDLMKQHANIDVQAMRPRPVTRAAFPSASVSARPATPSIPSARSSSPSVPKSSTPRATSS